MAKEMGNAKENRAWRASWKVAAVLLQACLFGSLLGVAHGQTATPEYQLKAIYLRKIPNFVQWPAGDEQKGELGMEPIHLCVIGNYSAFAVVLAQQAALPTGSEKKLRIQLVDKQMEWKGCQVVFVSRSEEKNYGRIVESLRGKRVLTVGETNRFLEAGGIVELAFVNEKLQFAVNLDAARAAELKLDARFVSLANRVIQGKNKAGI